ncbi:MAG: dienelactone hydrolase family protein [Bacteroidota bacterium]
MDLIYKLHVEDRYQVIVMGIGQGGNFALELATQTPAISATFIFYASLFVKPAAFSRIQGPVFGFYGEKDPTTQTIASTSKYMRANGKTFQPIVYEGADYGFMNSGRARGQETFNQQAMEAASRRLFQLVSSL